NDFVGCAFGMVAARSPAAPGVPYFPYMPVVPSGKSAELCWRHPWQPVKMSCWSRDALPVEGRAFAMIRYCLSLVAAVALLAPLAAQKPSDLLEDARRRQEIATQKAEADVQAALRQARGVSAAEATALLRKALDRVEQDQDINSERQAKMVRALKDAIRL